MKRTTNTFTAIGRQLLTGVFIAIFALTFITTRAVAQQNDHQPGYYQIMVGNVEVTSLSDGTVFRSAQKLLTHTSPAEIKTALTAAYLKDLVELSVNAYLIKLDNKLILIDTGSGDLFGKGTSHLTESLSAAGYRMAQIDAVLITHAHIDHIGGLITNDQLTFPNAVIYINRQELDYWLNTANMNKAPADKKGFYKAAMSRLNPYLQAGRIKTFQKDTSLFAGLTAVNAAGHTPGHTIYELENKGSKLVFCGDLVHFGALQFQRPSVAILYDEDQQKAILTRGHLFEDAALHNYLIAGDHISFPGIGHIQKAKKGYLWVPVNYSSIN
jgi:glyoxylase-like metal-dependent hydrolase (beta-lactamase superfamily II)